MKETMQVYLDLIIKYYVKKKVIYNFSQFMKETNISQNFNGPDVETFPLIFSVHH